MRHSKNLFIPGKLATHSSPVSHDITHKTVRKNVATCQLRHRVWKPHLPNKKHVQTRSEWRSSFLQQQQKNGRVTEKGNLMSSYCRVLGPSYIMNTVVSQCQSQSGRPSRHLRHLFSVGSDVRKRSRLRNEPDDGPRSCLISAAYFSFHSVLLSTCFVCRRRIFFFSDWWVEQ